MSLGDFQLIDIEPIDNSIVEREYSKIYHQQGAQLKDPNPNIAFIFGENYNYHQIGTSYLEFHITVRDPTIGFNNNAETRLVNNGFAFPFREAGLATTGGMEIEFF